MEDKRNVLTMTRYSYKYKDDNGNKAYGAQWSVDVYQYFDEREAKRGAEILSYETGVHVVALIPDSEIPDGAEIHNNI